MEPNFGCGYLFAVPTGGNAPSVGASPIYFATVQDISVEIDATIKQLRGNLQFPDDTAVADRSVKGDVAFGKLDVGIYNQLFFSDALTTGVTEISPFENHSVPASSAYTVTPTPPSSGTYGKDLGVRYHATGQMMQQVASGPTIGQYTESAGVYTFAAADASASVDISYTYTVAATGTTLTVNNQLQGYAPTFEMWLDEPYSKQGNGLHICACKMGGLSMPRKRDDYTIAKAKFEGFARADGQVLQFFQTSP